MVGMATRDEAAKALARIEQCVAFWWPRRALILVAIVLASWWMATRIRETWVLEGMLPAELHTTGLATVGYDATLFQRLGWLPYKSCGGAVFSLTTGTLTAIERQGLAFLDKGRKRRRNDYARSLTMYAPWRKTPVPPDWTSNGMWLGLYCMGSAWSRNSIYAAAQEPGSYYTTGYNSELLVVPRLGVAVFTFRGI